MSCHHKLKISGNDQNFIFSQYAEAEPSAMKNFSLFSKFKKAFAPFWRPWCRWLLCMYAWDIWIPAKMCLALDMESLYNVYVRGSLHTKASLFLPTLALASWVDSALPGPALPVVYFVWTDWLWHKRPVNNLVRRRSKLASKIACFSNTVVCIS